MTSTADRPKFSVVIPYKDRPDTLTVVLESLAEQTLDRSEFEVIVGVMEYSPDYVDLSRKYTGRLNLISVLADEEWNVGRARNLGLRNATGQVVITLDADIALPPDMLRSTWRRYYAHGQNVCLVGQLVGYDEAMKKHTDRADLLPWQHYRESLADLAAAPAVWDYRLTPKYAGALVRFPWAFVATGLVAVPQRMVREHDLTFDEGFRGWGPEDQEWGFRISRTGLPIVHPRELFGLHLPHRRDKAVHDAEAWRNNRYYLAKWPRLDLELALSFGWVGADENYERVERETAEVTGAGRRLGVVRGTVGNQDTVVVGALLDEGTLAVDRATAEMFDARSPLEVLPLVGFALPYPDASVGRIEVLDRIGGLSEVYTDAVRRETARVTAA